MEEATLTSKSQITMPKAVRDTLGLGTGDKVRFVPARNGYRIVAVRDDLPSLRGMFKGRRAKALGIDEMNAVIAKMGSGKERAR
jgi:antitoxin PrlF